ncbi:MAG: hypothetical protein PV340_03585 [Wolbachia sp.]|nr:hypothetical protein [Wolbachia sp.]MDD9335969.1 hypothetical protein [Wolbachia sp.]
MNEKHLELNSQNSKIFIELLKSKKIMYDCTVTGNAIDVIVPSEIQGTIKSIVKSSIKSSLFAKEEEKKLKEELRQLAFKDQAFSEYHTTQAINRYPLNHPLGYIERLPEI